MRKLSVIIPTFNEEENINKVIESVKFANEIIVVDSFSNDNTKEIANKNRAPTIAFTSKNISSKNFSDFSGLIFL